MLFCQMYHPGSTVCQVMQDKKILLVTMSPEKGDSNLYISIMAKMSYLLMFT